MAENKRREKLIESNLKINNGSLRASDSGNSRVMQETEKKAKAMKQDLAKGLDEDWDAKPPCPPQPPAPGAKLAPTSQDDEEWLAMAVQDPVHE